MVFLACLGGLPFAAFGQTTAYPSQTVTLSQPGWVTVNYAGSLQENNVYSTSDEILYNNALFDTGFSEQLTVTDPGGAQIASLKVSESGAGAPYVLSGSSSQLTFSGSDMSFAGDGTTNSPAYTYAFGASGTKANSSFNGSVGSFAVTTSTSTLGGGNLGYQGSYSGAFTFYASTPGTYTVSGGASNANWTAYYDRVEQENTGQNGQVLGSIDSLGISSLTQVAGASPPTGAISVGKGSGGATGVSLSWSVTPSP